VADGQNSSFPADADLGERHDRALSELERLRRQHPRLADSVGYDVDVRLAGAQQHGLASSAERIQAARVALVVAVEDAVADEHLLEARLLAADDETLAASRAAAEAAARHYEAERPGAT
jgi:uncharacterized protein YgbK (DUF1537 family)